MFTKAVGGGYCHLDENDNIWYVMNVGRKEWMVSISADKPPLIDEEYLKFIDSDTIYTSAETAQKDVYQFLASIDHRPPNRFRIIEGAIQDMNETPQQE